MNNEEKLLIANENLSKKLDNVEFELQMAREKIAQQKRIIDDLTKAKLKINSVWVIKDNNVRYVMQITDTFNTPNGVIVEGRV